MNKIYRIFILLFLFSGCSLKPNKNEETIYLLKTKDNTYLLLNEPSLIKYFSKGKYNRDNYFKTIDEIKNHIIKNNLFERIQSIQCNLPKLKPNIKIDPKYEYNIEWTKNKLKFQDSIIKNLTYFSCVELSQFLHYKCPKSELSIGCFGSSVCPCDYEIEEK